MQSNLFQEEKQEIKLNLKEKLSLLMKKYIFYPSINWSGN